MLEIGKHLSAHQKINLDQRIKLLAKQEAEKLARGGGGGGGGGIDDAPADGTSYTRKDLSWAPLVIEPALLLDQTTPQTVENGSPKFDEGIKIKSGYKLILDA